jgi:hypothetical protein
MFLHLQVLKISSYGFISVLRPLLNILSIVFSLKWFFGILGVYWYIVFLLRYIGYLLPTLPVVSTGSIMRIFGYSKWNYVRNVK